MMIDYSLSGSSIEHLFCHEANQRGFRTYKPNEDGSTKDIILENNDGVLVSVQIKKATYFDNKKYVTSKYKKHYGPNHFDVYAMCLLETDQAPKWVFSCFPKIISSITPNPKTKKAKSIKFNNWEVFDDAFNHAKSCRIMQSVES